MALANGRPMGRLESACRASWLEEECDGQVLWWVVYSCDVNWGSTRLFVPPHQSRLLIVTMDNVEKYTKWTKNKAAQKHRCAFYSTNLDVRQDIWHEDVFSCAMVIPLLPLLPSLWSRRFSLNTVHPALDHVTICQWEFHSLSKGSSIQCYSHNCTLKEWKNTYKRKQHSGQLLVQLLLSELLITALKAMWLQSSK